MQLQNHNTENVMLSRPYPKWKNFLLYALLGVSGYLLYDSHFNRVDVLAETATEAKSTLKIEHQKAERLETKNNQLVQRVKSVEAEKVAIKATADSIFQLQNKEIRKLKEVTRLSSVRQSISLSGPLFVPYVDTTTVRMDQTLCDSLIAEGTEIIIPPKEFSYESDSINMHGNVLIQGLVFDRIYLPNTAYTQDVSRKKGFLGLGRDHYVDYYNSNSLWRTDSAAVYRHKVRPNAWNRWIKATLAAVLSAIATSYFIKQTNQ